MLKSLKISEVITKIANLDWKRFTEYQLVNAAWMFYYFSVQMRKNIMTAISLYPDDLALQQLKAEELNTDNLSPFPNISEVGEKLDHDEYLLRALMKYPMDIKRKSHLEHLGKSFLAMMEQFSDETKVKCLASTEGQGYILHQAMLQVPSQAWQSEAMQAYRHFLKKHVEFDNAENGHATLVKEISLGEEVLPFWENFYQLLQEAIGFY